MGLETIEHNTEKIYKLLLFLEKEENREIPPLFRYYTKREMSKEDLDSVRQFYLHFLEDCFKKDIEFLEFKHADSYFSNFHKTNFKPWVESNKWNLLVSLFEVEGVRSAPTKEVYSQLNTNDDILFGALNDLRSLYYMFTAQGQRI